MDFEPIFGMPCDIFRPARLRPDIILAKNAPGGQQQREARPRLLVGGNVIGNDEFALATHEGIDVHRRRACRRHVRSEEHTSELQSLMRISYAVFCLKKKYIYTLHQPYYKP